MSDVELRRLREDLDTIHQAAGLGLPYSWPDVWETLALVPAGAFLSGWAFFGPGEPLAGGLVPLLLLALAAGARRVRRLGGGPARREQGFATVGGLALAGGLAVYFIWVRKFGLVHGPPGVVAAFFLGVLCLVLGTTGRPRRVYFAGAAALIPYALVTPLCDGLPRIAAVGGLAVMTAGLTAAAIMAWQLRDGRRGHEPATH